VQIGLGGADPPTGSRSDSIEIGASRDSSAWFIVFRERTSATTSSEFL
jgi:hypothetical protein